MVANAAAWREYKRMGNGMGRIFLLQANLLDPKNVSRGEIDPPTPRYRWQDIAG